MNIANTERRGALAALVVDGRLYAIGGNDGRRDLATVESFDSVSLRFQNPDPPIPNPSP